LRQVICLHHLFIFFDLNCHGLRFGHGTVNGDQLVVGEGEVFALHSHRQDTQIFAVLAAGNNIGIVYNQRVFQGAMGVPGDDHVNAVYAGGQQFIFGFFRITGTSSPEKADANVVMVYMSDTEPLEIFRSDAMWL
jgi:hypothetical protein